MKFVDEENVYEKNLDEFLGENMERFELALEEAKNKPVETPVSEESVDPFVLYQQRTNQLFEEVRSWLEETE